MIGGKSVRGNEGGVVALPHCKVAFVWSRDVKRSMQVINI